MMLLRSKKLFFIVILSLLTTFATPAVSSTVTQGDESFQSFYEKFTNNKSFQLSRVVFPLPGYSNQRYSSNAKAVKKHKFFDGSIVNVNWLRHNWVMHHGVIDKNYKIERITADSVVIEKVYLPASEEMYKSYFKKIKGLWYLVYYYDSE